MALTAGTRLGHYNVTAVIGEEGMAGDVASDGHARDCAIYTQGDL